MVRVKAIISMSWTYIITSMEVVFSDLYIMVKHAGAPYIPEIQLPIYKLIRLLSISIKNSH